MAQPALETFQYAAPENIQVRIGTSSVITLTTDTTLILNQIRSVSGRTTADKPKRTIRRLGGSPNIYYGNAEYESTCDIELIVEPDAEDYLVATNDTTPAELAGDTATNIQIMVYNTTGDLKVVRHLISAYPVDDGFDATADADTATMTLSFRSANKWITTTL